MSAASTPEHREKLEAVIKKAAEIWLIEPSDILSYSRLNWIADARQSVMVTLYLDYGLRSSLVGAMLGRDHGTVLYAVKAAEAKWTTDPEFREKFTRLRVTFGFKPWILRKNTTLDRNPDAIENAQ